MSGAFSCCLAHLGTLSRECQAESAVYGEIILVDQKLPWRIKQFLKAELKRADVSYEELARRMTYMGIKETKASIGSKLSRGSFSATFLVAALKAIEVRQIRLQDL